MLERFGHTSHEVSLQAKDTHSRMIAAQDSLREQLAQVNEVQTAMAEMAKAVGYVASNSSNTSAKTQETQAHVENGH